MAAGIPGGRTGRPRPTGGRARPASMWATREGDVWGDVHGRPDGLEVTRSLSSGHPAADASKFEVMN